SIDLLGRLWSVGCGAPDRADLLRHFLDRFAVWLPSDFTSAPTVNPFRIDARPASMVAFSANRLVRSAIAGLADKCYQCVGRTAKLSHCVTCAGLSRSHDRPPRSISPSASDGRP